jgi:hypothetical protein
MEVIYSSETSVDSVDYTAFVLIHYFMMSWYASKGTGESRCDLLLSIIGGSFEKTPRTLLHKSTGLYIDKIKGNLL